MSNYGEDSDTVYQGRYYDKHSKKHFTVGIDLSKQV